MAGSKHNGHDHRVHVTETPDVSHIKNVDVTHELSDVNVDGIVKFIIALTIMTVVTLGLMWALFIYLNRRQVSQDVVAAPGPMAMSEEERLPPEPRLQEAKGFHVQLENGQSVNLDTHHAPADPQAEYQVLEQQWLDVLEKGKTGPGGEVVAIPIEQAIKQVLQNNALPTRPEPGTEAITMPTAASSGRMTVKNQ
jgi:hypothetical protein